MNAPSERNVIAEMASCDQAIATRWSSLSSKSTKDIIPAAQYLTNRLLFLSYLEHFIVCLAAVTTQVTAANKQTRLVINAVLEVFVILSPAMLAYNYRPKYIKYTVGADAVP